MQGVARANVLKNMRAHGMAGYEWSVSFELLFRALLLTGYIMKDGDEQELYKDCFVAQLTQHEINLLYGRDFKKMSTGEFDRTALEALLNEEREIFGTYHEDKRVKDAKAAIRDTYTQYLQLNSELLGTREHL
jgi:hypothetical protein